VEIDFDSGFARLLWAKQKMYARKMEAHIFPSYIYLSGASCGRNLVIHIKTTKGGTGFKLYHP
jgi:hypothetical protein